MEIMAEILYRALVVGDAGEVLTVQRAAFVAEGRAYGNFDLPPLVETLDQVRHELTTTVTTGAFEGSRLVGSVRLTVDGSIGWISRLAVAPDQQGRGVGSGLLLAAEATRPAGILRFQLATGSRSAATVAMYERRGYEIFGHSVDAAGVELVLMGKDLPAPAPAPDTRLS